MRHIQVTVPTGERKSILDLLDEEGIDYVVTDEDSSQGYDAVVSFPVPTNAVEPVLDSLQEAGIDEESYTVVVDAETVISRQFEGTATQETEEVLAAHEAMYLLELEVEVREEGLPLDRSLDATQQIDTVVIEIGGPPGAYDTDVIETLDERINAHTTGDTEVQVRFVTTGGDEVDQPVAIDE